VYYFKHIFDLIASFIGLLFLSPLIILISFTILLTSGLPVFYLQNRVGKNGIIFKIIKFRTMIHNADTMLEKSITVANDDRITVIGKFLRRWKLDELPTLVNILKGDMSFVGPRPDIPGYADKLEGDPRRILGMRPGITGPATLKYSNEEQFLAGVDNPKKYNDEVIFPDKVKINLEYIDNWSLWMDIKIIFKTIFRENY